MNPAFSIVFFTTLAGSAQGLVVALALAELSGGAPGPRFLVGALAVALLLLLASLGASFLHLGHKLRAWRAVLMWRTSWMSREVIVLPAFIAVVAAWCLVLAVGASGTSAGALPVGAASAAGTVGAAAASPGSWLPAALAVAALLLSAALWLCTAMIYACLRFVQEWAHPITVANYTLIGLSSGLVLAGTLSVLAGEGGFALQLAPWALAVTLAAWAVRAVSLRRNAGLRPRSSLQSATGLPAQRIVQKSMGMTAGSFNTREFFHGVPAAALRHIKLGFLLFGFALPALLLAWSMAGGSPIAWLLALPLQYAGLVAERWFFFAQARHPQNLYYQRVS